MMQRLIIISVLPMSIPVWIKRQLSHTAQAIRPDMQMLIIILVMPMNQAWKEAIESYIQAIKINPDFADAHYNLGIAYVNSGMDKEAIESYSTGDKD